MVISFRLTPYRMMPVVFVEIFLLACTQPFVYRSPPFPSNIDAKTRISPRSASATGNPASGKQSS